MALTAFPNGITSFGVPVIGGATIPSTTGNYWFVSSVKGSDGNFGSEVNKPKATLAAALLAAVANNGDVIVLMPGHAETLTAALTFSATGDAGTTVVGLGYGSSRPTFTFTNTAAYINMAAPNCIFMNVRFVNGVDQQVQMVNVGAADCQFLGCEFVMQSTAVSAILGIQAGTTSAAATRLVVDTCNFEGIAAGTTMTAAIELEGTNTVDYYIRNNYLTGKATQLIQNGGTTLLRGTITNNEFVVYTGTKGINMAASSTPFIVNNRFNVASGTTPIVAAAGFVAGNVYSAAAGVTAGTASTF